ncbi:BCCT family transporter [Salinisphaera sp. LB1]|uniref:BCCT family transporter n=1 Tax=Salinisphaera sp. LB1 TaxID=2183911 RepID=UPI000D7086A9|nr:BCCT family transporter [Salinisphaera sp. LB1]
MEQGSILQQRLFWATIELVAVTVLLSAITLGGCNLLLGLQLAAATSALPFCLVLVMMCFALYKALNGEAMPMRATDAKCA